MAATPKTKWCDKCGYADHNGADCQHNIPPYEQRVAEEQRQLGIKIESLQGFFASAQSGLLDGIDRMLLQGQLCHMWAYHDTLSRRLAYWAKKRAGLIT